MSHRKTDLGIPVPLKSAKVVLADIRKLNFCSLLCRNGLACAKKKDDAPFRLRASLM
jgi:hypothetical protein